MDPISKTIFTPDHAYAHAVRGLGHASKGEHDRTIADFSRAVELERDHAQAHSERTSAHYHEGDYQEAWADVRRCRKQLWQVSPQLIEPLTKGAAGTE